jgi:hypothetical protein
VKASGKQSNQLVEISDYTGNFDKLIALITTWFHAGFLLGLSFNPEDGGDIFLPPKRMLTFNRLHGIILQKTGLFEEYIPNEEE